MTRGLSEALERVSCLYSRGRPVSVVRVSSGLEVEVVGTRVEAMDRLSSAREWEDIVVV